jgi:integrase
MDNATNTIYIKKSDGKLYSMRIDRNRIFTPDEWAAFYNTLSKKLKPLFLCLINTGARINEVINIKKKDIDFKESLLTLKVTKKRTPYSTGNPRTFKISTQYCNQLKEYTKNLTEEDKLFKVGRQAAWRSMQRNLKKANIKNYKDFSLHNIRKTTECWLNFLGSNYLLILKHMGHDQTTSLNHYLTTDIYNSNYKFKARQILGDLYM